MLQLTRLREGVRYVCRFGKTSRTPRGIKAESVLQHLHSLCSAHDHGQALARPLIAAGSGLTVLPNRYTIPQIALFDADRCH